MELRTESMSIAHDDDEGARLSPEFAVSPDWMKDSHALEIERGRRMVRIGYAKLTLFTRNLAVMLKAGLPLLRCLETLEKQEKSRPLRNTIGILADDVRSGGTLSESLVTFPRVFNRLYVNMVRAGETGGVLDVGLFRLATFMEENRRMLGRIKVAMIYPIVVILVSVVIVALLMIFVVPKFQLIFDDVLRGAALPPLTQLVISVSVKVDAYLLWLLISAGLLIAFGKALLRTSQGERALHWILLRFPVYGGLLKKVSISRFCRTFGTLIASGVPILDALSVSADVVNNRIFGEALASVYDRVRDGESLAGSLGREEIFPHMVMSMVEVGEATGGLPPMLEVIAQTFDEDTDQALVAISSLIEPVMIVALALIVGTIVIALFLPIISIIENLGG